MLKAVRLLGAAVVAGGAAATPAVAADRALVIALAPQITQRCQPVPGAMRTAAGSGTGVIAAADLGRAIYASKVAPLVAEYEWNRKGGREIARMAFTDDQGVNSSSLNLLQILVQTWANPNHVSAGDYLPFANGGVAIEDADGSLIDPQRAEGALAAILEGKEGTFLFRCTLPVTAPAPTPTPGQIPVAGATSPSNRPALAISKGPEDLGIIALADRPYAEIAYVSDKDANENSLSIYGTVGLVWPDIVYRSRANREERGGLVARFAPTVFAQIEREGVGKFSPNDVDNLNLGLQLGGFLQTRTPLGHPDQPSRTVTHYIDLNARYLSDTRLDSSGWSVAARFTPGIPLPGSNVAWQPLDGRARLRWRLTGVADYVSIDDPGRKAKLVDAPRYGRLGFDIAASARYYLGAERKQAILLTFDYSLRKDLGRQPGNAQLLAGRFLIEPTPNFSFGVAYDRGENLDTLEHNETIKLTLGVRR